MQTSEPSASSAGYSRKRSRSRDVNEEALREMERAGVGENASLREHFSRTGTTGAGADYLAKKERLVDRTALYAKRDEVVAKELLAFLSTRLKTHLGRKFASKNQKKEARGKR